MNTFVHASWAQELLDLPTTNKLIVVFCYLPGFFEQTAKLTQISIISAKHARN